MREVDLGRVKALARELIQILDPVVAPEWGPLGAEFWVRNGEVLGATKEQIRFACALHLGSNQAQAARLAGYHCTAGGKRAGHQAARSTKVQRLLELADQAVEARKRYGG